MYSCGRGYNWFDKGPSRLYVLAVQRIARSLSDLFFGEYRVRQSYLKFILTIDEGICL